VAADESPEPDLQSVLQLDLPRIEAVHIETPHTETAPVEPAAGCDSHPSKHRPPNHRSIR